MCTAANVIQSSPHPSLVRPVIQQALSLCLTRRAKGDYGAVYERIFSAKDNGSLAILAQFDLTSNSADISPKVRSMPDLSKY